MERRCSRSEAMPPQVRNTFIVRGYGEGLIRRLLKELGLCEACSKHDYSKQPLGPPNLSFHVQWCAHSHLQQAWHELQPWQLVNHFPHSFSLSSKAWLHRHLRQYCGTYGQDGGCTLPLHDICPWTYDLQSSEELCAFLLDFAMGNAEKTLHRYVEQGLAQPPRRQRRRFKDSLTNEVVSALQALGSLLPDWLQFVYRGQLQNDNSTSDDGLTSLLAAAKSVALNVNAQDKPEELLIKCKFLVDELKRVPMRQPEISEDRGFWVLKEPLLDCGRGVSVHKNISSLLVEAQELNWDVLVQRYIERPLLVGNVKCDVRLWVLVTSWNPITVWVDPKPYFRLAQKPFTFSSREVSDPFVHLTNRCVQKKVHASGEGPLVSDEDYIWTLSRFFTFGQCKEVEYIAEDGNLTKGNWEEVWNRLTWPRILEVVRTTVLACQPQVVSDRLSCFELFGFDFMMDQDMRPWLLEANAGPDLGLDSGPTLRTLLRNKLKDMLSLVMGLHANAVEIPQGLPWELDTAVSGSGSWRLCLRTPRPARQLEKPAVVTNQRSDTLSHERVLHALLGHNIWQSLAKPKNEHPWSDPPKLIMRSMSWSPGRFDSFWRRNGCSYSSAECLRRVAAAELDLSEPEKQQPVGQGRRHSTSPARRPSRWIDTRVVRPESQSQRRSHSVQPRRSWSWQPQSQNTQIPETNEVKQAESHSKKNARRVTTVSPPAECSSNPQDSKKNARNITLVTPSAEKYSSNPQDSKKNARSSTTVPPTAECSSNPQDASIRSAGDHTSDDAASRLDSETNDRTAFCMDKSQKDLKNELNSESQDASPPHNVRTSAEAKDQSKNGSEAESKNASPFRNVRISAEPKVKTNESKKESDAQSKFVPPPRNFRMSVEPKEKFKSKSEAESKDALPLRNVRMSAQPKDKSKNEFEDESNEKSEHEPMASANSCTTRRSTTDKVGESMDGSQSDKQSRSVNSEAMSKQAHQKKHGSSIVLSSLAADDTTGAIVEVVRAMQSHSSSTQVQLAGCWALQEMIGANSEDQQAAVADSGGLSALVSALMCHQNSGELVVIACGVLHKLAVKNKRVCSALVEAGGAVAIVAAMQIHPTNGPSQLEGCRALQVLMAEGQSSAIVTAGGAEAITRALTMHVTCPEVLPVACMTLQRLALHSASALDIAIQNHSLQAVTNAIYLHAKRPDVLAVACSALGSMAVLSSVGCDAIIQAGGVEAIVGVLQKQSSTIEVKVASCGALWRLASGNDQAKSAVAELGGLEAITNAAMEHLDSASFTALVTAVAQDFAECSFLGSGL